jgi:hypothetical protein
LITIRKMSNSRAWMARTCTSKDMPIDIEMSVICWAEVGYSATCMLAVGDLTLRGIYNCRSVLHTVADAMPRILKRVGSHGKRMI